MRIGLTICAGLLALATVVAVTAYRARRTDEVVRSRISTLSGQAIQQVVGASDMLLALETAQRAASDLVASASRVHFQHAASVPDDGTGQQLVAAIDAGMEAVDAQLRASRRTTAAVLPGGSPRATTKRFERMANEVRVHRDLLRQVVGLARSQPASAQRLLSERVQPHYLDVLFPMIQRYQERAERDLRHALAAEDSRLAETHRSNAFMVLLGFGAAGAIGTLVMWRLMRSIGDLRRVTARLRAGDLGARVSETGEFAGLAACLNEMASSLQATTVSRVSREKLIGAIDQIVVVSGQDGRVQLINLAAIERLGWEPREVIGRQLREVMRGADGASDVELVARDGTTRVAMCTPRTLHDPAGHPVGRVWIARDGVRV